jgi:hypothetical protein
VNGKFARTQPIRGRQPVNVLKRSPAAATADDDEPINLELSPN